PRPAVAAQVKSNFYIEVLCQELLKCAVWFRLVLAELVGYPFGANRAADVRIGDVEVFRVEIGLFFHQPLGELIKNSQRLRIVNLPVANIAPVVQTLFKDTGWRLIALSGEKYHPSLVARYLPTQRFHEHRL